MDSLIDFLSRITPGLAIVVVLFFVIPRRLMALRIAALIFGFILMRDAMTPLGYWNFGVTDFAIWLRFINDGWLLATLAALSVATSIALLYVKDLHRLVQWGNLKSPFVYVAGVAMGILVAAPFLLLSQTAAIEARGGVVPDAILPALAFMSLAGNFLEELIFRGFLQSYIAKYTSDIRAATVSAVMFAAAHIFLASTVTDLGWPLILFTLAEGVACAFIYRKYGLVAAAFTHATAIFMLASGLI